LPSLAEYAVLKLFSTCPAKQNLPWNFPLHWIYFLPFRIFEQLAITLKPEFALNSPYWIYIFLHSGFLSNLHLPWKTWVALKCFTVLKSFYHSVFLSNLRFSWKQDLHWIHCIENIILIIQDFWAHCACPKNRVSPEYTVLNIYFSSLRIFEKLALTRKNTSCPDIFHFIEYIFLSFKIFEQLALPLKNTRCPDILHCIEIFLLFSIFEPLALFLKTEFALNLQNWIYIFYHWGFLSNLLLFWEQGLPWNFSSRRGRPSPRVTASYAYGRTHVAQQNKF